MPDKQKVGIAQLKVGILGIVALACITLLIFLLTGSSQWFKNQAELHTYTSDAAGLTTGSPVRINGIGVGNVKTVALSGETNPQRVIKIDFAVDRGMLKQIPLDSIAAVASDNLLGSSKFLAINKGVKTETVQSGSTIASVNTQQFDALVQQGFGVLNSMQAILTKVSDIVGQVENGKGSIGKLLVDDSLYNSLKATVDQVQILSSTLNSKKGTIGRLVNDTQLYDQAESVISKLDAITQSLQQGQGTAGLLLKDPKLYNDLDHSLDQINTLVSNLNAGKGTAGELLHDDKLAHQLSGTMDRIDVTLDKVNSGQGTIGRLMNDPALYDAATATTKELHEFLKDFRANPKKFLSIKLHIF